MGADRRATRRHVRCDRRWSGTGRRIPVYVDGAQHLGTAQAIIELSVLQQVDFAMGIVTLNPPRPQNKKRRPRIRLTDNLRGWLLHWNLDKPITYFGRPVGRVDNRTLKRLAAKAGHRSRTRQPLHAAPLHGDAHPPRAGYPGAPRREGGVAGA
jgi:hypothetical protein